MKKTINIDFDNSSSILLGYDPDMLGGGITKYALSTHTHGTFAGTNITLIASASNGLELSVADPSAAANSLYVTGPYLTRSTLGISTTLGVTGIQSAGAYLTTAAESDHVHGGAPSITGNIGGTIGIGGWSLSEPGFLLTAAQSDHTHTYMGTGTTVGATNGTLFKMTANSDGLNVSVPPYLTTAAQVSHLHGTFAGTNITRVYSSTDGLRLSVETSMGTNTSSDTVLGTDFLMVGNKSGLTVSVPKFITTQKFTDYGSNYLFSGFSSSSVHTDGIPYGLSLTASPGNLMTLDGNTSGTLTLLSSGTVTIAGGDNITLSQDGNAFTIVGAASGTDPGIAFSMSTSNTSGTASLINAGTLYMQGGDNVTLSQESNTINIVGAPAGIVGISNSETLYTSGSVILSEYSNITISSSVDGTNQYFRFSVPDPAAATNAIDAGDFLSSAVAGAVTSLSVTGLVADTAPHIRQIAASDSSYTSGSVQISGSNNVTVSYNASTILISGANTHAEQTGISGIAGSGASTITAGTVQFANLNGISFGLNGSTMTASYNSTHTHGSNVSTLATTGTDIKFSSSSNGLTMGIPPYITIAGSHTHGSNVYSSATTGTDLKFTSASNSLLIGVPLFAVTSHTHSNLYSPVTHIHGANTLSFSNFYSSTTGSSSNSLVLGLTAYPSSSFINTSQTGNVYFENGSGVSFGSTYSSLSTTITGSIDSGNVYFVDSLGSNVTWGSSTNGISTSIFLTAGGGSGAVGAYELEGANTAGTTSLTLGTKMYLSGGNNITLSGSSNTIVVSAGAAGGIASFTLGGNIAPGASSTVSGSQIQLIGGGNLTLSAYDGTNLRLDAAPSGTLSLINSNGVSFGSSSAGSTTSVSASVETAYIPLANSTKFGQIWQISSNTSGTSSSSFGSMLRLVGSDNITLSGGSNGISIIGGVGTHTHSDYVGLATTEVTGASATINSSQLKLNIPQGSIYYVDSNGLSFGATSSGLSTTITASVQPILFADIAGFSFTSSSTGTSTYWYLKTA